MKKLVQLLLLLVMAFPVCAQPKVGLSCDRPIDIETGEIGPNATPEVFSQTGAKWVRLNMILSPWSSPQDKALHSGRTWEQAFRSIVDGFTAQGVEVYALIGSEAVARNAGTLFLNYPGEDPELAGRWIEEYAGNFLRIARMFRDKVHVYETYNEPNNWAAGHQQSIVHPKWFARMQTEIYKAVKSDRELQHIRIVSGPIFTHDSDSGGDYIDRMYAYGISDLGWEDIRREMGSYPLDGLGMHIYPAPGSTDFATLKQRFDHNSDAMWNAMVRYEGAETPKKIWLSELGWKSSVVGEEGQAANIRASYEILRDDTRYALVLWFSLQDFEPDETWGLFRVSGFSEADRKKAFFTLRELSNENRPRGH